MVQDAQSNFDYFRSKLVCYNAEPTFRKYFADDLEGALAKIESLSRRSGSIMKPLDQIVQANEDMIEELSKHYQSDNKSELNYKYVPQEDGIDKSFAELYNSIDSVKLPITRLDINTK